MFRSIAHRITPKLYIATVYDDFIVCVAEQPILRILNRIVMKQFITLHHIGWLEYRVLKLWPHQKIKWDMMIDNNVAWCLQSRT